MNRTVFAPGGPLLARSHASLALALGFLALAAGVLVVPLVERPLPILLTLVTAAVPVWYLLQAHRRGALDWFDVFVPFSALYLFYFGISTVRLQFNPESLYSQSLYPYLLPALVVATAGYGAFSAGYLLLARNVRPAALTGWVPTTPAAIVVPGVIGFVGQLAAAQQSARAMNRMGFSAVLSAAQQFSPLLLFGFYLLSYCFWARLVPRRRLVIPAAFYGMAIAYALAVSVGGKAYAITMLAIPLIALWYARRVLPWKTILALVLVAVFVIFPVYNTFRLQSRKLDTAARLDRTVDMVANWNSSTYMKHSVESFLNRMTIVTSVAAILRDAGRYVDYEYGRTLFLAPIGLLVPRVLWPDKPNISIGREFGEKFQLVNPVDRETQIAPSVVGEFYWNFHLPGVLVGMFLLGAGYRWFYRRYGADRGVDPLGKAAYVTVLVSLVAFEGNFAMLVGTFAKTLLILTVLVAGMRRFGWVAPPRPGGGPGSMAVYSGRLGGG